MVTTAELLPRFAECITHTAATERYKFLYHDDIKEPLMEALRLTHVRIVDARNAPVADPDTPQRQRVDDGLRTTDVRNWAQRQGMVLLRGRVNKTHRDAYREAHGMTAPEKHDTIDVAAALRDLAAEREARPAALGAKKPETADVRRWAIAQGIDVGDRGRIKPAIIEAYKDAHE